MAAASSRCRWCSREIPTPASATAAATGMQVYDERTTGMHWQTHKQGAEHYRRLLKEGKTDAHGRGGGDRFRPGDHVLGDSAAAARPGRDDDRRIPARQAGGDGEVRDVRPRSAGQCRDRAGRLRRARRAAHRRPVRRPHRFLFARRRIPGVSRHLRHAAQASDLRDHHRGAAADGGFLHGQSDRADLSAADATATARNPRHLHAGRGHLPQPDSGVHPQVVSAARAQSDARDLGPGTGDVQQMHRGGG